MVFAMACIPGHLSCLHRRLLPMQIKPDGVQRGLVAAVIKRFEDKGYKLVGIKVSHPTFLVVQPSHAAL